MRTALAKLKSPARRVSRGAGVFAVLALLWVGYDTGNRGLDFGKHWDEWHHFKGLENSARSFELLPEKYVYHGLYHAPGYLRLLPKVYDHLPALLQENEDNPRAKALDLGRRPELKTLQAELLTEIRSPAFLLEMRRTFLGLSLLMVVWTYLCMRVLDQKARIAAIAAAAVVGTSWEFAYQARYVAVDAPMAASVGLFLLTCALVLRARTPALRLLSTTALGIAAGLTFSFKLTGLAALVVAGLAIVFVIPENSVVEEAQLGPRQRSLLRLAERAGLGLLCLSAFFITFFITTPGAFLDPFRYLAEYAYARHYYFAEPTPAYAVEDQATHLGLILTWLLSWAPSPWRWCALFLSAFAPLGIVAAGRKTPRFVVLALAYATLHLLLTSASAKLIVRNQLPLLPILAVFIGIGIQDTLERAWETGWRSIRIAAAATATVIVGIFVANITWLSKAADTVVETTAQTIADDFLQYMAEHPQRRFFVSRRVAERIAPAVRCEKVLGKLDPGRNARFVFASLVDVPAMDWRANQPGFAEAHFGSLEVNYTWYPTWEGKWHQDRISVVGWRAAQKLKIDWRTYRRCRLRETSKSALGTKADTKAMTPAPAVVTPEQLLLVTPQVATPASRPALPLATPSSQKP